jgi:hypothetical protein
LVGEQIPWFLSVAASGNHQPQMFPIFLPLHAQSRLPLCVRSWPPPHEWSTTACGRPATIANAETSPPDDGPDNYLNRQITQPETRKTSVPIPAMSVEGLLYNLLASMPIHRQTSCLLWFCHLKHTAGGLLKKHDPSLNLG